MMNAALKSTDLQSVLRGVLRLNEPMSRHTVWSVGGPAQRLYEPADLEDLSAFLSTLTNDEPVFWVGLGSNLLVRDGGIVGTVVLTAGLLNRLHLIDVGNTGDACTVRVEAGVPCAKAAKFCARNGLRNSEFLAGIPGTMGGALAMNAGAFGRETWDVVSRVEVIDRRGHQQLRTPNEYSVEYRNVRGPQDEWFVAAELSLPRGESSEASSRIRELLQQRSATQPTGQRSCGSVFRNPPGDYAARLIESSGLKGTRRGGAQVSEKHANFIVNVDDASAEDIEVLIEHVRKCVGRHHGVHLVREVHIVGETKSGDAREK